MMCPNLKNPQVAQEFNELVQAVGEKAAYDIWNQNNGYGIESAPNGAPSKLFSDLLSEFDGNRELTIKAKAKVFSKEFKTWFGDSKVVDENGEPLLCYHNTTEIFKEFDPFFFGTTDPGDSGLGFYFTPSLSSYYDAYGPIKIPVFLSIKNPVPNGIGNYVENCDQSRTAYKIVVHAEGSGAVGKPEALESNNANCKSKTGDAVPKLFVAEKVCKSGFKNVNDKSKQDKIHINLRIKHPQSRKYNGHTHNHQSGQLHFLEENGLCKKQNENGGNDYKRDIAPNGIKCREQCHSCDCCREHDPFEEQFNSWPFRKCF